MTSRELLDIFIKYPEVLTDRTKLFGLLNDLFPKDKNFNKILLKAYEQYQRICQNNSDKLLLKAKLYNFLINEEYINESISKNVTNTLIDALLSLEKLKTYSKNNYNKTELNKALIVRDVPSLDTSPCIMLNTFFDNYWYFEYNESEDIINDYYEYINDFYFYSKGLMDVGEEYYKYNDVITKYYSIDEVIYSKLLKEQISEVLETLSPREAEVIRLRFGLEDGIQSTYEEIGRIFNVTRERIKQIEAKALRKLRHPTRSDKLKDFL